MPNLDLDALEAAARAAFDATPGWPRMAQFHYIANPQTILALSAELRKREWQPIETAPKDGTRILVSAAGWITQAFWESDRMNEGWYEVGSHWTDAHDGSCQPTHWQSLPEPPQLDRKADADKITGPAGGTADP